MTPVTPTKCEAFWRLALNRCKKIEIEKTGMVVEAAGPVFECGEMGENGGKMKKIVGKRRSARRLRTRLLAQAIRCYAAPVRS